jgi:hypothetical protein
MVLWYPKATQYAATHGFRDAAKAIGHGTRDTVHTMAAPTAERPNSQIPHVMVSLASTRAVVGPLRSGGGLLRTLSVGAASTDIQRWPLLSLPTRSPFFGRGFQCSLRAAGISSKGSEALILRRPFSTGPDCARFLVHTLDDPLERRRSQRRATAWLRNGRCEAPECHYGCNEYGRIIAAALFRPLPVELRSSGCTSQAWRRTTLRIACAPQSGLSGVWRPVAQRLHLKDIAACQLANVAGRCKRIEGVIRVGGCRTGERARLRRIL